MKFYLLGPNIDGISQGFEDKYNAVFYKTDYSLVEQLIEERSSTEFGVSGQKKVNKENALFNLLFELIDEQTIIYCSSPARARYLAKKFLAFLDEKIGVQQYKDEIKLVEWIEKYVSKDWILAKCLKNKIAFHDGALQKHITSSVVKYFNEEKLRYLFCTSTLIEGVNTSAKNIVIFDNKKGSTKKEHIIDYFDYSNIKGRAGRMMVHYIGKVYNFNSQIPKSKDLIVDIPFFQQNPIKDEVLIHLDDVDVIDEHSEQYIKIKKISEIEKELIKKNGISFDGQREIINLLRNEVVANHSCILWNRAPTYEQLKYVLNIAWKYLIKDGESRNMTLGNLVRVTFWYEKEGSISWLVNDFYENYKNNYQWVKDNKDVIEKQICSLSSSEKKQFKTTDEYIRFYRDKNLLMLEENDLIDNSIQLAFNILRHWFQYKVPKLLRTMHSLQEYICVEKNLKAGNYLYYANKIENDFIRGNLSILAEYGIPKSAIQKIEKYIKHDIDENQVVKMVKDKLFLSKIDLLEYEKETIINSI